MRPTALVTMMSTACLLSAALMPFSDMAEAQSVKSLRGDLLIEETNGATDIARQNTAGRFERAYRQQPPLIPHRTAGYQVNLKVNQCLSCHDWPNNVEQGAPKVSETHYFDRDGVALDQVSRTRWFCTQCHVPQSNARELVKNDFKSAIDLE